VKATTLPGVRVVARGCRCGRAEPSMSNPQLKINEAETISAAVTYAPQDSLDAVTREWAEAARSECSPLRPGLAGTYNRYPPREP